jgi:hypothetical protein
MKAKHGSFFSHSERIECYQIRHGERQRRAISRKQPLARRLGLVDATSPPENYIYRRKLPMGTGIRCRTGFPSLQHFHQRDK